MNKNEIVRKRKLTTGWYANKLRLRQWLAKTYSYLLWHAVFISFVKIYYKDRGKCLVSLSHYWSKRVHENVAKEL